MGSHAVIVLDTHALIWWASGDDTRLSTPARKAITDQTEAGSIVVSSITAWELAMLVQKERISLSMDVEQWLDTLRQIDRVRFHPVDNDIAIKSANLPGEFHKDPADRMIVATARKLAAPLVTADEKIRAYAHVKCIW